MGLCLPDLTIRDPWVFIYLCSVSTRSYSLGRNWMGTEHTHRRPQHTIHFLNRMKLTPKNCKRFIFTIALLCTRRPTIVSPNLSWQSDFSKIKQIAWQSSHSRTIQGLWFKIIIYFNSNYTCTS
ncbi:hypothetical protein AMTRI_Chr09g35100 [Amborella trichopoda]